MKMTAREYFMFFGGSSKDAILAKCRNGELDAVKDEKGRWIIDCPVPEEVFKAKERATELRDYANALFREQVKVEREIEELMSKVLDFQNGWSQL